MGGPPTRVNTPQPGDAIQVSLCEKCRRPTCPCCRHGDCPSHGECDGEARLYGAVTLRSLWVERWENDATTSRPVVGRQVDGSFPKSKFVVEVFVYDLRLVLTVGYGDIYRTDDLISKLATLDCENEWQPYVGKGVPA